MGKRSVASQRTFSLQRPWMNAEETGAWLETLDGGRVLVCGNCSFGRTSANTVAIDSPEVSRRHAIIHAQNQGEFWLIDLGSSNGTFLNKRRVQHPVRLIDQDRIAIGTSVFTFRESEDLLNDPKSTIAKLTVRQTHTALCWLLVADIQNFTPLSRNLTAEALGALIGSWVSTCKGIIEKNHGTINKYLGDGFLAYWQADQVTVQSILATLAELKTLQKRENPGFRIALHLGDIALGGLPSMGEVSLMGSEVNFVFRMEKLAGTLRLDCIVSSEANGQLGLTLNSVGRHRLKGFEEDHAFFC